MKYFCDNPECIAHVMVEDECYTIRLPMSTPYNYKELWRHEYTMENRDPIALCTTCARAVQMFAVEEQL